MNLRDRLCCRGCGRRPFSRETYHRGFEYHHITPVREGGRGVAGNIVLLCKRCHRLADAGGLRPSAEMLSIPERVPCFACGADLDPRTIGMNCGWYDCPSCGKRTHLYDQFVGGNPAQTDQPQADQAREGQAGIL